MVEAMFLDMERDRGVTVTFCGREMAVTSLNRELVREVSRHKGGGWVYVWCWAIVTARVLQPN